MRGKCSSKGKSMEVMESPSSKPEEEPHLSGAYIRSLVKHLSSSRPKGRTTNPKSPDSTLESLPPPPPPPRQPKKQVRRRLHTSRPYQERLLNMADARREIVTALKFHRASMKQANVEHRHQPPRSPNPTPSIGLQSWSYPTLAPLPDTSDNLNFLLPNKPLGLNLNFHVFNDIYTPPCDSNNDKVPPVQPLLPPHYSSSSAHSYSSMKMHVAMDEKEMEEIRSIGEMHDIEWSDTMNLITSAWWSKLIETLEVDSVEGNGVLPWLQDGSGGEGNGSHL